MDVPPVKATVADAPYLELFSAGFAVFAFFVSCFDTRKLDRWIPPVNRKLAVTQAFGRRGPSRGHLEHFAEQTARRGVERFFFAHHAAHGQIVRAVIRSSETVK